MTEWKNMTVQALRDLARKALGRGHSKLKTKRELIAALRAAERKVAGAAERAATRVRQATGRVEVSGAEPPMSKSAKPRNSRVPGGAAGGIGGGAPDVEVGEAAAPLAKRARAPKAQAAAQPPAKRDGDKGKPRAKGKPAAREPGRPRAGAKAERSGVSPPAAPEPPGGVKAPARRPTAVGTEPDPEGYMVARVAGEEALRDAPHPMTESALDSARKAPSLRAPATAALDEVLGDLPWSYGDDVLVALPRDPTTLFLYWDHAPETLRKAWEGLDGGRPQLRVSVRESGGEWATARAIEFTLESRSYYVHDLTPGRFYRVEIHIVDRSGRDSLLARASNEVQLPPAGPSPVVDDRFMALPWSESLQRLLREARPGGPFSEDLRAQLARLSDWSRFSGRAWGGWGASAGGMGGRPFSPASSPSSPAGAWGRPDGKGR